MAYKMAEPISTTNPEIPLVKSNSDGGKLVKSESSEFWYSSDLETSCFRLVARALTDRISDHLLGRIGSMSVQDHQKKELHETRASALSILRRTETDETLGTLDGTWTAQDLQSRVSRTSIIHGLLRRNNTELSLNSTNVVAFQDQQKVGPEPQKTLKRVQTSPGKLESLDDFSRLALIYGGN